MGVGSYQGVCRRRNASAWLVLLAVFAPLVALPSGPARAEQAVSRPGPSTPASAAIDLERLMELFASSGGVRADFHQTRRLSLLEDPIETSGVMYFSPPDTLARHTTRPGQASVVVRGSTVVFRDETGEQIVQLGASEVAQAIVGNLAVLLRGDLAGLRDRYRIEFRVIQGGLSERRDAKDGDRVEDGVEGGAESWELDLVPRSKRVRAVIERLRFAGQGNAIARTETYEANGDTTVDRFSDVQLGLEWDPAAFERIFSLDGASHAP